MKSELSEIQRMDDFSPDSIKSVNSEYYAQRGINAEVERLESGNFVYRYSLKDSIEAEAPPLLFVGSITNPVLSDYREQIPELLRNGVPEIVQLVFPFDRELNISDVLSDLKNMMSTNSYRVSGVCVGADFIIEGIARGIFPSHISDVYLISPFISSDSNDFGQVLNAGLSGVLRVIMKKFGVDTGKTKLTFDFINQKMSEIKERIPEATINAVMERARGLVKYTRFISPFTLQNSIQFGKIQKEMIFRNSLGKKTTFAGDIILNFTEPEHEYITPVMQRKILSGLIAINKGVTVLLSTFKGPHGSLADVKDPYTDELLRWALKA